MLKSSSIFGKSYLPEKALLPSNMYYQGYFCSKKNVAPVHWWMEFQEPIAVTSIIFHEKYKGCIYEFWGCNGTVNINDSYKCTGEKKIFSCGTQKALLSSSSSDNALYYVYGLTAIELGNNGYMGISGFKFGKLNHLITKCYPYDCQESLILLFIFFSSYLHILRAYVVVCSKLRLMIALSHLLLTNKHNNNKPFSRPCPPACIHAFNQIVFCR